MFIVSEAVNNPSSDGAKCLTGKDRTFRSLGAWIVLRVRFYRHLVPNGTKTLVLASPFPTSFSKLRARDRPDRWPARPVPAADNLWLLLSVSGCPCGLAEDRSCLDRLCRPSSR